MNSSSCGVMAGGPCCLTFELTCARRQTTLGRARHDATDAWSGQALAAVARQVERGVRPHWLWPMLDEDFAGE